MRLRQAHAILEAAAALEGAGLGIEMYPFDHDRAENRDAYGNDYMTGFCEVSEGGWQARIYNIDLIPGSEPDRITGRVDLGMGPSEGRHQLLHSMWSVAAPDDEGEQWRSRVGAALAERIVEEIRAYEAAVEATFREMAADLAGGHDG